MTVSSVTEIPVRIFTPKQTIINHNQIYFTKNSSLQQRHTLCRLFQWKDTTTELEIHSIFLSEAPLAIQNNTTVASSTIGADLTVPAISHYDVTIQRVGKIRKQNVCVPIKTGKRSYANLN